MQLEIPEIISFFLKKNEIILSLFGLQIQPIYQGMMPGILLVVTSCLKGSPVYILWEKNAGVRVHPHPDRAQSPWCRWGTARGRKSGP